MSSMDLRRSKGILCVLQLNNNVSGRNPVMVMAMVMSQPVGNVSEGSGARDNVCARACVCVCVCCIEALIALHPQQMLALHNNTISSVILLVYICNHLD